MGLSEDDAELDVILATQKSQNALDHSQQIDEEKQMESKPQCVSIDSKDLELKLNQKSKEIADLKQKLKRERLRNRLLMKNAQRVRLDEDVVIDIGIDESKKEKKVRSSGRVVLGTVAAVAVCTFYTIRKILSN